MEIDGGPPPFCGGVVADDDDSFDPHQKNGHDDYDDDEDEEEPSSQHLPLPSESRSRSVTPEAPPSPSEVVKGDTNPENVEDDDDDEWGDFGEAVAAAAPIQKQNIPPPSSSIPPLQMSNNDDDDDDWGAFDQARPSTDRSAEDPSDSSSRSQEARQLAHQQSLEEWGAFEQSGGAGIQNKTTDDDDEDEWQAEFTSASTVAPPPPTLENLKFLEEMIEDVTFWDDGFAEGDDFDESLITDVIDIPSLFDSESLETTITEEFVNDLEKQKYSKLWLALRVIEEAISLKFDWNKSEIRKNHLKSLKINPIIVKKETRSTAAVFDTSNLLLPTPVQSSSDSTHDASSSSSNHHHQKTSTSSPSVVDSPSVPAVDFDWDTSGLTNPMNRANQSSAIIDVDFLASNGVATAYTSTLQKDLEHFGLTNGTKTSSNGSSILEILMSRANGTTSGHRYQTPEVLSLDAQKLLEKLPDLQYLQSEVLMFPIGTNLPH